MHPLIKYIEQYCPLEEFERDLILASHQSLLLNKKEYLYKQGEVCPYEAFVLSGTLRVFNTDSRGGEHVLNFALPTWWVGDIGSFYEKSAAFHSVQALEDSELLVITREKKEELFHEIPKLERVFRIVIQKHLMSTQKRFLTTISEKADQRYLNLIAKIPQIEQLVPQHQIASYLGILPESLSRLKKQLIDEKRG